MKRATTGVLIGGGVAATLDIVYAFVMSAQAGISPTRVLFVAAALYLAASRRFPLLRHRAVTCGLVFGVGVYLFMNFVVVPLAAVPFELSYTPSKLAQGFLSHSVLVGLPIALAIRRYSAPEVRS